MLIANAALPAESGAIAQPPSVNTLIPAHQTSAVRQVRPQSTPRPENGLNSAEFSPTRYTPASGSQLYALRLLSLRVGRLYTRLPMDSFYQIWSRASNQLNYDQWRWLLQREATVVAKAQSTNFQKHRQLGILLGDSLSLWFPSDRLPSTQLWLNQSISGDTTRNILRRLPDFAATRPRVIYLMAGINDLKNGATDAEVLWNLRQIITQLQYRHPQAQIVVQSILPTRTAWLPSDRAESLNRQLAVLCKQTNVQYLDLYSKMVGDDSNLRSDLTTDGLHLNAKGYAVWQEGLQQAELQVARRG
jgi:lysophospholipase L1-like esterase